MNDKTKNETPWYYVDDGAQAGPVPESALKEMLEGGSLHPQTLVWKTNMKDWVAASETELLPSEAPPAPPSPESPGAIETAAATVRPWPRFTARMVDYFIFSFAVGALIGVGDALGITHIAVAEEPPNTTFGLIILFAWLFVEPWLLSTWGTTPGKWLLSIKITMADGSKPDYSQALGRSFSVWLKGMGAGLPIISLVTLVLSYMKLTSTGATSWDKECGFTVSHEPFEPKRAGKAIFFIVAAFFVTSLLLSFLGTNTYTPPATDSPATDSPLLDPAEPAVPEDPFAT